MWNNTIGVRYCQPVLEVFWSTAIELVIGRLFFGKRASGDSLKFYKAPLG